MNFREIDRLKAELDALRPLPPEVMRKLNEKLRLDWNYHSNALEGNTLTYGETRALLLHDRYIGNKEGCHYREIRAHDDVIQSLDELVKKEEQNPLSEKLIKELHEQMLGEPYYTPALTLDGQDTQKKVIPGQYKIQPNSVRRSTGDMFFYADPVEVPGRMGELLEEFRKQNEDPAIHPIQLAAWFHYVFIRIHPFDDGNGRLARILMNLILMRRGYVPAIVTVEAKAEYLDALQLVDATDELEPFIEVIAKHVQRILDLELRAAKGDDITEPEDWKKELHIIKQKVQHAEAELTFSKLEKPEIIIHSLEVIYLKCLDFFQSIRGLFSESLIDFTATRQGYLLPFFSNQFETKFLKNAVEGSHAAREYAIRFHFHNLIERVDDGIEIKFSLQIRFKESCIEITLHNSDHYHTTTYIQLYKKTFSQNDFAFLGKNVFSSVIKDIKGWVN